MNHDAVNAAQLIAAIKLANALPKEAHTITLTGKDEDYVLHDSVDECFGPLGFPKITTQLTIEGNGHIISRSNLSAPFRFFIVMYSEKDAHQLTLNNLTLCNGDSGKMGGGALVCDARTVLNGCIFRDNWGTLGGAIYAGLGKAVTINNCVFWHNVALEQGGGVFGATTTSLSFENVLFYENHAVQKGRDVENSGIPNGYSTITIDMHRHDAPESEQSSQFYYTQKPANPMLNLHLFSMAVVQTSQVEKLRLIPRPQPERLTPTWLENAVTKDFENLLQSLENASTDVRDEAFIQQMERMIVVREFSKFYMFATVLHRRQEQHLRSANALTAQFNLMLQNFISTPDFAQVDAAFRLLDFTHGDEYITVAQTLAATQPLEILVELFNRYGDDIELLTAREGGYSGTEAGVRLRTICLTYLAQEMVLRGVDCEAISIIKDFVEREAKRNQYQYQLPLKLLPIENRLVEALPVYTKDGIEHKPVFHALVARDQHVRLELITRSGIPFDDVTETPDYEDISTHSKTVDWMSESKLFRFQQSIQQVTAGHLLDLGLECLAGTTEIGFAAIQPNDMLYISFATLRAIDTDIVRLDPGVARDVIWESLRGLVGASLSDSLDVVADLAAQSQFYAFNSDSRWLFNSGISNFALAVLRPDGVTLAISAIKYDYIG